MTSGPLQGVRVIEVAGLGAAPFGAMVLADLGAEVITVERPPHEKSDPDAVRYDVLRRGRTSVAIDLKKPAGLALLLRLVADADVVIEGFRPGVAERLGFGPDVCLDLNPRVVFARMTGWGQDGPHADRAGHDLTYIAVAGALAHIGRADQLPTPPLNLVGDFGGGGLLLALGVVSGVLHARATGQGQVIDAAMVDGAALQMAALFGASAFGFWSDRRGSNLLDSGAPFYDVYRCSDGLEIAVGAIEPQFFAELLDVLGLAPSSVPEQHDQARWPELRAALAWAFTRRTRAEWIERADGRDACLAPVHTVGEAGDHPQIRARSTIVTVDGVPQPAPAPRFSVTPGALGRPPVVPGADTDAVLAALGHDEREIAALRSEGVVG
jgi:alpha-methylacyl-CoA racemase